MLPPEGASGLSKYCLLLSGQALPASSPYLRVPAQPLVEEEGDARLAHLAVTRRLPFQAGLIVMRLAGEATLPHLLFQNQ
jgi:hypothetical protein